MELIIQIATIVAAIMQTSHRMKSSLYYFSRGPFRQGHAGQPFLAQSSMPDKGPELNATGARSNRFRAPRRSLVARRACAPWPVRWRRPRLVLDAQRRGAVHEWPRRWFASSRSRSARGLHSAGREAALPSAPERRVPAVSGPGCIEAEFYFPKNLDLESRTDAMVAPIHWPGLELGENMGVGLSFSGRCREVAGRHRRRRDCLLPCR